MVNILLVDDDDASHVYHKLMIKESLIDAHVINSVFSVDEAIHYLRSINGSEKSTEWPDYIFLDLNMPVKTGYDFIEEYKSYSFKHKLPKIYFVSSTKNPVDIERANSIDILQGFETKFLTTSFFDNLVAN